MLFTCLWKDYNQLFAVTFSAFIATYLWDFHMNKLLRCLIVFLFLLVGILSAAPALAGPSNQLPLQEETATAVTRRDSYPGTFHAFSSGHYRGGQQLEDPKRVERAGCPFRSDGCRRATGKRARRAVAERLGISVPAA